MKKLTEKNILGLYLILIFIGCGVVWFCNILLFLISDFMADSLLSSTMMIVGIHFLLGANGLAYVYGIFKKSKAWKIWSVFFSMGWIIFYLLYLSRLVDLII